MSADSIWPQDNCFMYCIIYSCNIEPMRQYSQNQGNFELATYLEIRMFADGFCVCVCGGNFTLGSAVRYIYDVSTGKSEPASMVTSVLTWQTYTWQKVVAVIRDSGRERVLNTSNISVDSILYEDCYVVFSTLATGAGLYGLPLVSSVHRDSHTIQYTESNSGSQPMHSPQIFALCTVVTCDPRIEPPRST